MKGVILSALFIVSTLAEPPINNRYLPPRTVSGIPSQLYGAPGFGIEKQTTAGFRGRPSSNYGAPSTPAQSISNQYIPPRTTNPYQAPTSQYQAPISVNQTPASLYQAPASLNQAPFSLNQAPSSLYQAPASLKQTPISQYQAPSSQYGLPSQSLGGGGQYVAPSQEYGPPGGTYSGADGQNRQYLPPGSGYDDGSNGEPANYDFEYMVLDQYSGNDFGHRESRQGDHAQGRYYVLLPDGRKQTVEYEADQDGYKPRISYEDIGSGYNRKNKGYDQNGPY